MKIFLTGGSGFIGKAFIKEATRRNNYIFAISRKKQKTFSKVKWLNGDLADDWSDFLGKSDVLVHLASQGIQGKKKSKTIFKTNISLSLKLVKNAIRNGCKNYLIISSSSEYGYYSTQLKRLNKNSKRFPQSAYSISKAKFTDEIKKLSKKSDCRFRVMRIFPVFGEGEANRRLFPSLKKAAKSGKNFTITNPSELRDFSRVEYISKVLIDACFFKKKTKKFEIFHVASNKHLTVRKFAETYWKKFKAKGKLKFKNEKKIYSRHLSDISSTWKIKNE